MRRTATLALLLLSLAAPGAALAQGSPFAPLPPAEPPPVTVERRDSLRPPDDGLDTWQTLLIVFGGVAVVGGIAFAILGDARRHLPSANRPASGRPAEGLEGNIRSEQHRRQKARNRQKAKAARAARKRTKRGR